MEDSSFECLNFFETPFRHNYSVCGNRCVSMSRVISPRQFDLDPCDQPESEGSLLVQSV